MKRISILPYFLNVGHVLNAKSELSHYYFFHSTFLGYFAQFLKVLYYYDATAKGPLSLPKNTHYPAFGKWGDFVDYREFVQSMLLFCVSYFFYILFKFDHELCFITENKQRIICRNITTTPFHICASAMPRAKRSILLSWSYLLNTAFPDKNTQFQVFSLYSPFTVNGL